LAANEQPRIGYTYKALAAATGLSARFWRLQVAEGNIPFVKFKQAVIILPADLDAYLAERRRVKNGKAKEEAQNSATIEARNTACAIGD
jgi:hypothetical protein